MRQDAGVLFGEQRPRCRRAGRIRGRCFADRRRAKRTRSQLGDSGDVPIPKDAEIESGEVESLIAAALSEADTNGISGKRLTPFLLNELSQKSGGKTLAANVALLENNARVAAEIAKALNY